MLLGHAGGRRGQVLLKADGPNLRLDAEFEPPFVLGTAFRSPPALHARFG